MIEYVLKAFGSGLAAGVVAVLFYVLLVEDKATDAGGLLVGILAFLAFFGMGLAEGRDSR